MSDLPKQRLLALPERLLTRGFQRFWRFSRGHRLRAEAIVWNEKGDVLLTCDERLPGAPVRRGEAAEDALRNVLTRFSTGAPSLVAITLAYSPSLATTSTYITLFEVDWHGCEPPPSGHSFRPAETLEGTLEPELLTMIQRRAALRRQTQPT